MTQQVVRINTKLAFLTPLLGGDSFDTIWEGIGTSTDADTDYAWSQITTFLSNMATYVSFSISQATNAVVGEVYDITAHLNGSPAGPPIHGYNDTYSTGITSSSHPLPEGACVMFGYRSDYGTDEEFGPGTRPRARHRGRFHFGPLNTNATQGESGTGRCIFQPAAVTAFTTAFNTLLEKSSGTNSTRMVQWSRKNAAVAPITQAWFDDAPRYERLRVDPSGIVIDVAVPT